ncbi:MAG: hypothetical protein NT090_13365 [Acidobacteria bacterium]|nr:hypothetical protein [Acidobacteriota bacterium]
MDELPEVRPAIENGVSPLKRFDLLFGRPKAFHESVVGLDPATDNQSVLRILVAGFENKLHRGGELTFAQYGVFRFELDGEPERNLSLLDPHLAGDPAVHQPYRNNVRSALERESSLGLLSILLNAK